MRRSPTDYTLSRVNRQNKATRASMTDLCVPAVRLEGAGLHASSDGLQVRSAD
jgi:hypothetical protein